MNDMIPKGTRHFATFQRASVMILGFFAKTNTVYYVNLDRLPHDEMNELLRLALSSEAQKQDTMSLALQNQPHSKTGRSWLEHLWNNRQQQWVAGTFPENLSDMNPAQKNYFKGFGRSLTEEETPDTNHVFKKPLEAPTPASEPPVSPVVLEEINEAPVPTPAVVPTSVPIQTGRTPSVTDEEVVFLRRQVSSLTKTLESQQNEIAKLIKKIPGKPGRPSNEQKAKVEKVQTGKPTPVGIIGALQVEG